MNVPLASLATFRVGTIALALTLGRSGIVSAIVFHRSSEDETGAIRTQHRRRAACRVGVAVFVFALTWATFASARVVRCPAGDVICLTESILSANQRRGPDTIVLEAGTYTAVTADNTLDGSANAFPSVTSRLMIEGAGPAQTIVEVAAGRIFHVGATGVLTLEGLTIRGGHVTNSDGGAIFNRGTVTLLQSVVRDNLVIFGLGGAVHNLGALRIVDCRITENGVAEGASGGIDSSGPLEVLRSTIDHNFAESGGGLWGRGTTTIRDSTVDDNEAFRGSGGGLMLTGTATVVNTTIARNGSFLGSGGGLSVSGTAHFTNTTIADNVTNRPLVAFPNEPVGALDVVQGTVQLQNTILARNTRPSIAGDPLPADCVGSVTSLGNNLIGDPVSCTIDLGSTDLTGDAGLGTFVNAAEPGGGYIPLLTDSPAIDAGNGTACPRTDQLGQRRVDGDGDHRVRCDIGAVEFTP